MVFVGKVFQQIVGIPMGTTCAPLLADIFLHSFEAEVLQSLLSTAKKPHLSSNSHILVETIMTYCPLITQTENYLGQMYPTELEIEDTTESNTFILGLAFIDWMGRSTSHFLFQKSDNFNLNISYLRPPMAFLYHSSYDMPGLALPIHECFVLRAM